MLVDSNVYLVGVLGMGFKPPNLLVGFGVLGASLKVLMYN